MPERQTFDWEAIEREFRAGQLSVSEIGRMHGLSHTAINKRAKRDGWSRDLTARVRAEVSARLVSDEVATANAEAAVETAAARGVEVIRSHRQDIGIARRTCAALLAELQSAGENLVEIRGAIEAETADDKTASRRASMLKAVSLGSRSSTLSNLANAMRNLIALERSAFNLDKENGSDDRAAPDATIFEGMSDEEINVVSVFLERAVDQQAPAKPTRRMTH